MSDTSHATAKPSTSKIISFIDLFDPVLDAAPDVIEARRKYNLIDVRGRLVRALEKRGKEYKGIERPKYFRRQWKQGECFYNAAEIVFKNPCATYVEGVAYHTVDLGFHHAWVTIDGVHAIDQTWPKPGIVYVGIDVPTDQLLEALRHTDCYGHIIEKLEMLEGSAS
jgi:hypothetical protein